MVMKFTIFSTHAYSYKKMAPFTAAFFENEQSTISKTLLQQYFLSCKIAQGST